MPFQLDSLSIVIIANKNNPTILNPDFLKYNDIISKSWELASKPICQYPLAKVEYVGGFIITSQPDRLVFTQKISPENTTDYVMSSVASKYLNVIPHVEYSAVGINPHGHFYFEDDSICDFFIYSYLLNYSFKSFSPGPIIDSDITLVFNYDEGRFSMAFERFLDLASKKMIIALKGNYHYDITGDSIDARRLLLSSCINKTDGNISHILEICQRIEYDIVERHKNGKNIPPEVL